MTMIVREDKFNRLEVHHEENIKCTRSLSRD